MIWFLYFLMGIGLVGMLWANRQYKARGVPWGRPLAALLGLIAFFSALSTIIYQMRGDTAQYKKLWEKEQRFQYIGFKKLGEEVAKRYSGARILLIREKPVISMGPSGPSKDFIDMAKLREDAFREGLGTKAKIAAVEYVATGLEETFIGNYQDGNPPSAEDYEKLKEELFTAEKLDKLIENNNDCNVVVSFLGLPSDMETMKYWSKKPAERPVLILANAYVYTLKPAIKYGYCPLILYNKPGKNLYEVELPKDEQAAFDLRYLFITQENVDKIASEYPNLFAKEEKK